jgi:hypothetical protein
VVWRRPTFRLWFEPEGSIATSAERARRDNRRKWIANAKTFFDKSFLSCWLASSFCPGGGKERERLGTELWYTVGHVMPFICVFGIAKKSPAGVTAPDRGFSLGSVEEKGCWWAQFARSASFHSRCPTLGLARGRTWKSGQFPDEHSATCSRQVPPPPIGSWMQSRHLASIAARRLAIKHLPLGRTSRRLL